MRALLRQVERGKLFVSSRIVDWNLAADLASVAKYPINVPINPFSKQRQILQMRLDANRLYNIFERIWKQELKPVILQTLKSAEAQLRGREVAVILLSGGSSNIGWLRELMKRDIRDLDNAPVLELRENFQEVVAKGLAIECARKFFKATHTGDFHAVTYNQLCLALRADDGELEIVKFRPDDPGVGEGLDNGVLLQSASSLGEMLNVPLRWRFKMANPPRRQLEYFFMSSSLDPDDRQSLHNVDRRIFTPSATNFSSLQLELVVREDGTTTPTFVYAGGGTDAAGRQVEGVSFALPMTFGGDRSLPKSYVSFDFGSSSSSFSVISEADISVWDERSRNPSWLELSDLLRVLPYPAAAPLAYFIADTGRLQELGRESVEGLLAVAAYVAYMEYSSVPGHPSTKLLKNLAHRSAGPLWAFLKQVLEAMGSTDGIAKRMRTRLEPKYREIDQIISNIAKEKHGKISPIDFPYVIQMLGNMLTASLGGWLIGSFEDVQRKRVSRRFIGTFREITGNGQPFVNVYDYEGDEAFSEESVYLYNQSEYKVLCLTPLLFWYADQNSRRRETDLYLFDSANSSTNSVTFKAVQPREELVAAEGDDDLDGPYRTILEMRQEDPSLPMYSNVVVTRRDEGSPVG